MTPLPPSERKVVTRSPIRKVGIINCRWFQQHPIEYESQLEKRFVYSALLCPGIREIKSQPFTLPLAPGSYTPDFLLDYGDQMIVIEVKPSSKITKYIEVFDWASRFLQEFGIKFYVATEQGIDRDNGACASAAAEILRYAKSEVDGAIRRGVLTVFGQDEEIQLIELERRAAIPREVVMHLLALRWIALQVGSGIEDHAHVRIARYEPETALLEFERRFDLIPWTFTGQKAPPKSEKSTGIARRAFRPIGPYLRRSTIPETSTGNPLSWVAGGFKTK